MNSKEISQVKHILSSYLDKDTKVIDLCCGDNCYSTWLNNADKANIIPMSPEKMEHICHENPFVAYNNFINDERKVPVEDTRADTVLLLGPLYSIQTPEKRVETIKEIKRLIKDNGTVITISNNNNKIQNSQSPEFITVNKTETEVLEEAGFTVEKTVKLSPVKTIGYKSESSSTTQNTINIARIKPAISSDAIPPEVILQIPEDVLDTLKIEKNIPVKSEKTEIRKSIDDRLNSKEELKEESSPETEIKQSIDITLQKRYILHKSIDPTLQPEITEEKSEGVNLDLPILPKEITDKYNISPIENNTDLKTEVNSVKEINEIEETEDNSIKELSENTPTIENFEIPDIPIRPSIDKNLVVRENKKEIMCRHSGIEDFAKVHDSIDKTLQMNIPKINPRYAKPKSKKKGTKNLIKRSLV